MNRKQFIEAFAKADKGNGQLDAAQIGRVPRVLGIMLVTRPLDTLYCLLSAAMTERRAREKARAQTRSNKNAERNSTNG